MAAYGYVRVSTERQATEGESLDVQRRQIEGWCIMHGEDLAQAPFQDEGVSGSIPVADRPAGREMLAALQPGDVIVAAKLDRLFRSALDALQTIERLKARNIKVWLIDLGEVTGNGMAKAFLTMASAFAELERDMIRERVTLTKSDQRKRGRYLGGYHPFGFVKDERGALRPDPAEQSLIKEILRLRAKRLPLRAIQARLEVRHCRRIGLATIAKVCSPAFANGSGNNCGNANNDSSESRAITTLYR